MSENEKIIRVSEEDMKSEFLRILLNLDFSKDRADTCAGIFTTNSLEGVYSHGVNRFPRFVKNVRSGMVKPSAEPALIGKSGGVEQWNGNLGPGPLNALFATGRVTSLAEKHTIGMVTLSNTNHWMRAGYYGWQAARKGFMFMCWTNTCRNMPAWGATDPRLGNNPFVIAVPYGDDAVVLDMAMSQFSYGKMEHLRNEGRKLPYPGGYDSSGNLTTDPAEILKTWRPVPAGYWKGAGLSLLLDILASSLSGGLSTHEIESCESEHGVSQVFIAVHLQSLSNFSSFDNTVSKIIEYTKNSVPDNENTNIRYPGEMIIRTMQENKKNGIPVNKEIWNKILSL